MKTMTDQKKTAILCPNCRKLISKDEFSCPYCGIVRPGSRFKNNIWTRGFNDPDRIIKIILYLNISLYVISLLFNPMLPRFRLNPMAFLSPENKSLLLLGATGTLPIDALNRWWTLISANYLHGNILHIFFNMFAFKQIAPLVVQEYGVYRMFVLYTLGGAIGFFVSYLAGVAFTIGASAALTSLIGASLYFGKSRGGVYGQTIYKQLGAWTIGIFIFGFIVPGINNWGHGGGIAAGVILGFLLGYHDRKPENLFHKLLAGGCMVLTITVLMWAVGSGIFYRLGGR